MMSTHTAESDADLLAEYARTRSGDAFSQLVARYVDLVYAAAVRQTRDAHLADDVTQAVFVVLARRAGSIDPKTQLGGWFLLTARHVARNAMKQEWRLKRRERKAAAMAPEAHSPDASIPAKAEPILPLLDDALARLSESDRDVILARFFNARSHREVGEALGVTEQAASKRVSRALARLRELLESRGVTASEAMLSSVLPAIALKTASPALVASIHASVAGAAPPAVALLAKSAVSWSGASIAAMVGVAAAVIVGTSIFIATVMQTTPAPAPPAPPPAAPVAAAPDPGMLAISAIDPQTKQPLAGATVQVRVDDSQSIGTTDSTGRFAIPKPTNPQFMHIRVSADGRAPMMLELSGETLKGELSSTYTIPLETGTPIGGQVLDQTGNPLADARVRLMFDNGHSGETPRPDDPRGLTTDPDGRWSYASAPSRLRNVYIDITHPDYPGEIGYDAIDPAELRAQTAIVSLFRRGNSVSGTVVDSAGKPVQGAEVRAPLNDESPRGSTDAAGKFELTGITEHHRILLATASGYAPQLVNLDANLDRNNIRIELPPPNRLEVTIVDPAGNPLPNVRVAVEDWRHRRAIEWRTTTDAQGRFVWNEAPADTVHFSLSPRGRGLAHKEVILLPGKPEQKITLYPPLRIAGRVIDAETKQPIEKFEMTYAVQWAGQQRPTWQSGSTRTITNGNYEADISQVDEGAQLRVLADGYLPAESRLFKEHEGNVTYDFELRRGQPIRGTVVDAQQKPIGGVHVYCIPRDSYLIVGGDNHYSLAESAKEVETAEDGGFGFEPQKDGFHLVAISEAGFASISTEQFKHSSQVELLPWGSIRGQISDKFAGSSVSTMSKPGDPGVQIRIQRNTTVDADGAFKIERVPPGPVQLLHHGDPSQPVSLGNHTVKPGEALEVKARD